MARSSWLPIAVLLGVFGAGSLAYAGGQAPGHTVGESAFDSFGSFEPLAQRVFPAPGTRVPRNVKLWTIDTWGTVGSLLTTDEHAPRRVTSLLGERVEGGARNLLRFELPRLEAGRSYVVQLDGIGQITEFSTSNELDYTPPSVSVGQFTIRQSAESERGLPVSWLDVAVGLDSDGVLVRLDLHGDDGLAWSMITTPEGLRELGRSGCGSHLPKMQIGERVTLDVRAIDLAGNESQPVQVTARVAASFDPYGGCSRPRHWRCGTGDMGLLALIVGVAFAAMIVLLVVGIVRIMRREQRRDASAPEAISLLVVERLARIVQRRGGVLAAIGLAGVPALIVMDHELGAIPLTILACIGIRGYAVARGVLKLLEHRDATADVRATTIYVRDARIETQFEVSERQLARALRYAVPASIAKRS